MELGLNGYAGWGKARGRKASNPQNEYWRGYPNRGSEPPSAAGARASRQGRGPWRPEAMEEGVTEVTRLDSSKTFLRLVLLERLDLLIIEP